MKLATWNVLHRVHAENWAEAPRGHEDEAVRTADVAQRVKALAAECDAVCLQEVSGDLLSALRGLGLPLNELTYPRIPNPRSGKTPLVDRSEHLVVVGRGEVVERAVAKTDPGKGFLSVRLESGVVVVSTHVTWGERSAAQLGLLAEHLRSHPGAAAVCGDFNAEGALVHAALGDGFTRAEPSSTGLPTRPRAAGEGGKSQNIDHVFGWRMRPVSAEVRDCGGLSDHNVVVAELRPV